MTSVRRDECFTDASSFGCPNGDVLQIGIFRAQPTCGGNGLLVIGVDTPCFRVNQFRQGLDVRTFQFSQFSVRKYFRNDGVDVGQFHQDFFSCRILPCFGFLDLCRNGKIFKEYGSQLLWAINVECFACQLVNMLG